MFVERRGLNHNSNELMQRALDPETDPNERFRLLAASMLVERQNISERINDGERAINAQQLKIQKLEIESKANAAERKYNIEKTIDTAIKHFQNLGHAKIGGAIFGEAAMLIAFPFIGLFTTTIAAGVSVKGMEAYEFEQELRRIRKDPEQLAALGSTSKEVEDNIQKMWNERETERFNNSLLEISNIQDPTSNDGGY